MFLRDLGITNYKSLRSVDLTFERFTLLVGANGAGKSNIAECLEFLADVYKIGLSSAVEEAGGVDNIAFRRGGTRARKLEFRVSAEITNGKGVRVGRIEHDFEVQRVGRRVASDYRVISERITISAPAKRTEVVLAEVQRSLGKYTVKVGRPKGSEIPRTNRSVGFSIGNLELLSGMAVRLDETELLFTGFVSIVPVFNELSTLIGAAKMYQIDPDISRDDGEKTPRPEMSRFGSNLPAVVSYLQIEHPRVWADIEGVMRHIIPSLVRIRVTRTSSGNINLSFVDADKSVWSVNEVSDGTMRALALSVALFDPRNPILILEEPENSLHPWIMRSIIEACREVSLRKQIIVTSHSPVVLNSVSPESIVLVWKGKNGTSVERLTRVDPDLRALWEAGEVDTFNVLDSGVIAEALPPSGR